jgi:hypothetical protein
MIFSHDHGHHQTGETPNIAPPPALNTKFLFNTNERHGKSAIAVTHSKQTTEFPFVTLESHKTSGIAVTPSIPTVAPFSIQYKWTLRNSPPLSMKIANSPTSAVRIPRA